MIIKSDKSETKVNKEIPLSEFVRAELNQIRDPSTLRKSDSVASDVIILLECCDPASVKEKGSSYKETASHIMQHYKINERRKECQWIHCISLETRDRSFQLHSPSRREALIWLRVLQLIIRMNKIGKNASQLNPYVFEEQEKQKLARVMPNSQLKDPNMTLNFFGGTD